jgi:hypothetical protein
MKNKKSKYKAAIINKKRYYFYRITWIDILGDSGHANVEEFNKMKCAEMISYGYVFEKTNKFLKTFASYDSTEESFSDRKRLPNWMHYQIGKNKYLTEEKTWLRKNKKRLKIYWTELWTILK